MAFSKEWEEIFASGEHFSEYPWSNLVGLVMKYFPFGSESVRPRVLELGCGVGANIPFFLDKGFEYHAVEGSRSAYQCVKSRFGSAVDVHLADFSKGLPFKSDYFDLVVDRSSTVHNRSDGISRTIGEVERCLKSGKLFVAVDWFSTESYALTSAGCIESDTISGCDSGYLAGCGVTHFFNERTLIDAFGGWTFVHMAKKILLPYTVAGSTAKEDGLFKEAAWDFVVSNGK